MVSLIEPLFKSFPQEFSINFLIQFLVKCEMILAGNYQENFSIENRSISVVWDFPEKLSCWSNWRLLSGLDGGKDLPRNVARITKLDAFDGATKWGDSVKFPGTFDEIKVSQFLSQICQRSNKKPLDISNKKPNERHQKNPSNLGRPRHALENKNKTRNK